MPRSGEQQQLDRLGSALAERYRLEREVGRGGMAAVYLAEDLRHGRKVAIKVLRPELAAALGRERFLREIEITARLHHPHILPLYDSGGAGGFLYYAMPYVEGESLRALLDRERQLPIDQAVQIARQVADALSYAHRQDVLHRDIKPENILLESGHALVADFGIARAVTEAGGVKLTETGLAVGTPMYMSPEQMTGSDPVDARSDIYSLACVVYEMLVGDPPFTGSTHHAIMARKSLEAPPAMRVVRPTVPAPMDRAIAKALATTPGDRFRTLDEFLEALTARASPERPAGPRVAVLGGMTLVATAAALFGGWLLTRSSAARWAREEGLPQIIELIDQGDHVDAFQLASRVEEVLPEDPTLATLWPRMSRYTSLRTDPDGSVFEYREYGAIDAEFTTIGLSPIEAAKIPLGFFHWRIRQPGYETIELAASGITFPGARDDGTIQLYEEGAIPPDMVVVPGGTIDLDVPGLEHAPTVELGDYLIDRYEVTNREYKAFLDSGGYVNRDYWQEPFVRDGRATPWEAGMAEFVDATGRPGPAGWQVGTYPEGQDDHPVGGINWYEAAAYALFAGKRLPTIYHWRHAAEARAVAAHVVLLGNYDGEGPLPVGSSRALGPYGTYDMAGNVREWVRNPTGDHRYILGGAWGEPSYFYVDANSAPPWDRNPVNGVRLMQTIGGESIPPAASRSMDRRSAAPESESVPDAIYQVYEGYHRYDRTAALDDSVESVTDERDWRRETVTFRAAYGNDRMAAHLFLPRNVDPPYQVVVYFPPSNVLQLRSSADISPGSADFLVQDGRAVVYPIYQGTYERDVGLQLENPDGTVAYRDLVVMWSKDLRRTIDYLTTREDMDLDKLAYYGFSWGAAMGAIMPALEPRIDAVVLEAGGLYPERALPEADQRTFAPRVTQPVLMLNGRHDALFPLETHQRPLLRLFGVSGGDTTHILYETGHTFPRNESIKEILEWLDLRLGPAR